MPDSSGIMTPLVAVVQRGRIIYTEDSVGKRTPVCACANTQQAEWTGWSLARAHGIPHKIEPADKDEDPEIDELKRRLAVMEAHGGRRDGRPVF